MVDLDRQVVLWLHQWVVSDPALFSAALWLSDYVPWVLCAIVMTMLWFAGTTDSDAPGILRLTREESRQRVLLTFLAMFVAFMAVRPLAQLVPRERPMIGLALSAPIDPSAWQAIQDAVRETSPFPSDQSAFWFAMVAGVFLFNRRWGLVLGIVMSFFALIRISVGYVYPLDVIAGAAVGILTVAVFFLLRPWLVWVTKPVARAFDGLPMLAYPLGLLVLLDVTQRMTWTISTLATLFSVALRQS